jgi:hypothetical protein
MRMRNELWQGYCGYWQNYFIHQHILLLGYTAWSGYINEGRGMVVCHVIDAIPPTIDWSVDIVTFEQTFVPQVQAASYLRSLELEQETVVALLNAIAGYDPTQAIVILVIGNDTVDINLLQHLAIPPADCYQQVQQRWVEFQPDLTTQRRHG